jgi:NADH-quinone oxidoreductase subunit F
MERLSSFEELERYREKILAEEDGRKTRVCVCMTGCRAYGAAEVRAALKQEVREQALAGQVEVRSTGCHGLCARAPILAVEPLGVQYQEVSPEDAAEIVTVTLKQGRLIERLGFRHPETGQPVFSREEIPFYGKQVRRVLARCGRIDPTRIEHYVATGGYQALVKALRSMTPNELIEEVTQAKLRGRGGAGFPTGAKWRSARQAKGHPKYVICNADEGDPGAFMDRAVLEGDPHAVLEGMIIGAYAIGAEHGYIYVREEYPIAVEHFSIAIDQANALGLLGKNILGTGFDFTMEVSRGAGAFVCGESTALMASIEGKRGMPRAKYIHTVESGVWEKPSNLNNVETWANVPLIIYHGADWYGQLGTAKSKGTKIFSLAGKVNNTGLVEVPLGVTIKEVVFDIGGGIPKGRKFKAVLMGGPSGGCVPSQYLNLPIDYDTLQRIGSIMGSGGMVVMDENNCMVEIARFFLSFTQAESCGKCAPCRLGTTQLLEILTRITQGKGRLEDIEIIRELSDTMMKSSLCGLGQTAPKPALSTLNYFLKEYEAHILERSCAGATCDAMVISACQHACPAGVDVPNYVAAIARGKYEKAAEIIRERNPFPSVCGRICIHPCEFKCRRGELDEPVAIRSLKRFAGDWYLDHIGKAKEPFPVTKAQKVGVVGAGPSGLTCAYFLARMGYGVTVFEAQPVAGGMLGVAVPEFRLPRKVIQAEVEHIQSCGVKIRYNSPVDARHTVNDLLGEGFHAVFIGAGAQASRRIGIPGEEDGLTGLHYGLRFLTDVRTGREIKLTGKVLVLGGGNVAIDAARSALRLGAREVQVFYRRTREEMPAWKKDIDEAVEEGIAIHPSWAPKQIFHERGRITGIEFVRSVTVLDQEGRSHLNIDDKTTERAEADTIIIAIGQAPDTSFLSKDGQLERTLWDTLSVNQNSLATNIPGVFGGGDFTTGPSTVINAIASGRRAALSIDKYLKGEKGRVEIFDEKTAAREDAGLALDEEVAEERPRIRVGHENPEERVRDFREVERGFTEEEACREAMRCLRCDLEEKEKGL